MATGLRIQEFINSDLLRYFKLQGIDGNGSMFDLPENTSVYWVASALNGTTPTGLNVNKVKSFEKRYLTTPLPTDYPIYSGSLQPLGYSTLLYGVDSPLSNIGFYLSSALVEPASAARSAYFKAMIDSSTGYLSGVVEGLTDTYSISGYLTNTGIWSLSYNMPSSGIEIDTGIILPVTGVNVLATWAADYGTYQWHTIGIALTSDMLSAVMTNYNSVYSVTAIAVGDYTPATFIAAPRKTDILVTDVFTDYVKLSSIYVVQGYNYNIDADKIIKWQVSSPISAICVDNNETFLITNSLTGYAPSATHFKFLTAGNICNDYYISAYIPDETVQVNRYKFAYDPFVSETLNINVISATNSKIWLKLDRLVNGTCNIYNGNYNISPLSTVEWYLDPSASVSAVIGLTSENINSVYGGLNLNMEEYGTDYTFGTPGYAGIVNTIPLTATYSGGITAITGYDYTFGTDVIQINMDPNIPQTYSITGIYTDDTSKYDVFEFHTIFNTTNVIITAIEALNNEPYIRTIKLKGLNDAGSYYTDINPSDYIIWNGPSNTRATYTDGTNYTFNSIVNSTVGNTLNFYITTEKSDTPQLCSISIMLTAITGYNTPLSAVLETSYNFDVDEYPLSFDVSFKINNENPIDVNNAMYRLVSTYTASAYDLSNIPGAINTYNRVWKWGNGTTISTDTSAQNTYNPTGLTAFRINFEVNNVSAANWLSSHSMSAENYMDLVFVDRFLQGNFIAYPTQVFDTSASYVVLNTTNYTNSQGVCAYGEGHSEFINVSASETEATVYRWTIGNTQVISNRQVESIEVVSNVGDTFNTAGTAIVLDVFNGSLPITMTTTHTADDGIVETYPNIGWSTYDVDKYTQRVRILPYETPTSTISSNYIILQRDSGINISKILTWPSYSPVILNAGNNSYNWSISTNSWNELYSETSDSSDINIPLHDGTDSYGIQKYVVNTISLQLTSNIYEIIDQPAVKGRSWQPSPRTVISNTYNLSAYVLPNIDVYLDNQYALTGEDIVIENGTSPLPTGLISGFIWDNGFGVVSSMQSFDPYIIYNGYSLPDTYSVTLSVITFDGYVTVKQFPDIITVVNEYNTFNNNITRIYGETVMSLPYKEQDILIPPNEWVVESNINAAFDRLNANLTYIDNMSKAYNAPPTKYYGWLGYTSAYDTTDVLQWHLLANSENINNINTVNNSLSSINDITIKNNIIYIANGNQIELRSLDMFATLLSTKNNKAIEDYFVDIKSIAVDSDDRIYVLDKPRNSICVFTYDNSLADPWKLLYSWGGLGGAIAKNKFRQPNDMIVDRNNDIWVVDTGNLVIKKYSRSGSWYQTIYSDKLTQDNPPISITIDNDNNLHILTQNYIVKLDQYGEFIKTYNYNNPNNYTAKKIIAGVDGGFIYICTTSNIIKITVDGQNAGVFANDLNGSINYKSIYQDTQRNIYVSNTNTILKYYDNINILNTRIDVGQYTWDMEDIYIDKNEYVQDWVYNRSFSRMWDNLELFRRSIIGKIKLGSDNKYVIKGFTPEEYVESTRITDKTNIFIGINELVTADVINRCLKQLHTLQEKILLLID